MARRFTGMDRFPHDIRKAYGGGLPVIVQKELDAPLKLRKPSRVGVQFMGDLFHESVTSEQIAAVFGVMAACPQHTFFVLTKRSQRMFEWFEWVDKREKDGRNLFPYDDNGWRIRQMLNCCVSNNGVNPPVHHGGPWPLPNVWLGVSVENQKTADERIPALLRTPAAKLFVSCEPLLGPVDFHLDAEKAGDPEWCFINALTGRQDDMGRPCPDVPHLDWVIAGSETGPGARPCNPNWIRSIRDQCKDACVPFFLKQVNAHGDRDLDGRMHEETG
jgi:protein gp37